MNVKANRIDATLAKTRREDRAALMPYLPLGYPTIALSQELIAAIAGAGADIMELGMPFSDPLADGPVIAQATQTALKNGLTTAGCLEMVKAARDNGVRIPLVLMGYVNPILRYGTARFVQDARDAGADGLIVADVPPEEAGELASACRSAGLHLILLAAPTSTDQRLRRIARLTRGFVYLVSLTGVTGARSDLPAELEGLVRRLCALTRKPVCVGFGVSTPASARRVAAIADGVIVGSALVTRLADPATALEQAGAFVRQMRQACAREAGGELPTS